MITTPTETDPVLAAFTALTDGPVGRGEVDRGQGRMIRWVEAGSGSPAIVFEAGAASPVASFAAVFAALAGQHRVIAYDRAGYGLSDPTELSVDQQLGDLIAVLESAGPKSSILVGHSWGGLLVQLATWQRPDLVAGLVLVDPSDEQLWRDLDPKLIAESARHPSRTAPTRDDPRAADEVNDNRELAEDVGRSVAAGPVTTRLLVDACLSYLATDPQLLCHLEEFPMILDQLDLLVQRRAAASWPAIGVVVLTATKGRPAESTRLVVPLHARLAEVTGGRHQVVTDSGHFIHVDRPELVVACIREVIDQVQRTGPA